MASGGYTTSGRGPIDLATGTPPVLGVRVYQALDRNGDVVEYAFLVLQDFVNDGCTTASGQCDWNDSVLLVTNVRPVDPIVPAVGGRPTPTATPGSGTGLHLSR